jgi:hypothetical protein
MASYFVHKSVHICGLDYGEGQRMSKEERIAFCLDLAGAFALCREGKRMAADERVGGEGGIRTPDTVARMPHFECGAFNHSATSPQD